MCVPGQRPVLQLWDCVCRFLQCGPGSEVKGRRSRWRYPPLQGSLHTLQPLHELQWHRSDQRHSDIMNINKVKMTFLNGHFMSALFIIIIILVFIYLFLNIIIQV